VTSDKFNYLIDTSKLFKTIITGEEKWGARIPTPIFDTAIKNIVTDFL